MSREDIQVGHDSRINRSLYPSNLVEQAGSRSHSPSVRPTRRVAEHWIPGGTDFIGSADAGAVRGFVGHVGIFDDDSLNGVDERGGVAPVGSLQSLPVC